MPVPWQRNENPIQNEGEFEATLLKRQKNQLQVALNMSVGRNLTVN